MTKYTINGNRILQGDVFINGSKNATLPILAASILNTGTTRISNYPDISDVNVMLELLKELGCQINIFENHDGNILEIDSTTIYTNKISSHRTCDCRASSLLLGALLGRCKEAEISYPGGCTIGERPLDLHKSAFDAMGFKTEFMEDKIKSTIDINATNNFSQHIYLNFPSVGATENALLAAAGIDNDVHIYGAATEPEVCALGEYLSILGAKIYGLGTSHIIIHGSKIYKSPLISFRIIPDRIEAATYMVIAAGIGKNIRIHGVNQAHTHIFREVLSQMGCNFKVYTSSCPYEKEIIYEIKGRISKGRLQAPNLLIAKPYPAFPTDAQSIILPLLCISKGKTILCDEVFPNRFKAAFELIKAGGEISPKPYGIIIHGKKSLHHASLNSYDLRGGAAMIIAGLFAKGISTIYDNDYITRGYVKFAETLNILGADIKISHNEPVLKY